jgi:hypothetical protein
MKITVDLPCTPSFGRYRGIVNLSGRPLTVQVRPDGSPTWTTLVKDALGTQRPSNGGIWLSSKALVRAIDGEQRVVLPPVPVSWSVELFYEK